MNDMKTILNEWRKRIQLNESGLSRLHHHMQKHDCAILTAFRNDATDMSQCAQGAEEPSEGENNKTRNRDLKATLLGMKIGVTKVDGSYIEDFETPQAIEVSEDSLFCVNLKDDSGFFETIARLGQKYCQDSVLCIPKGGKSAFLMGTNNADFPGFGEKMSVGDVKFGGEAEFMTRVKNRPFTFNEGLETYKDLSKNQRMAVMAVTKKFLKEVYDQASFDAGLSNEDGTRTVAGKLLGKIARASGQGYSPPSGQDSVISALKDAGLIVYGLDPKGDYRANITDKGRSVLSNI